MTPGYPSGQAIFTSLWHRIETRAVRVPHLAKTSTRLRAAQPPKAEVETPLSRALAAFGRLRPPPELESVAVVHTTAAPRQDDSAPPADVVPPGDVVGPVPEPPGPSRRPRGSTIGEARRKQAERDEAARLAYLDKMRERGIPDEAVPPHMPMSVYRMGQSVLADRTGRKTLGWMELTAKRMSGYPLALVRAGFGSDPDLRDPRVRTIIGTALVMLHLARRVRRKGRWSRLVSGHSVNNLRGAMHAPQCPDIRLGRTAFGGGGRKPAAHRDAAYRARWGSRAVKHGTRQTTWKPVLQFLRDCGFLYAQQLPPECVKAWEKTTGDKPRVRNRYWIACVSWPDLAERAAVRGGRMSSVKDTLLGMLQEEFNTLNGAAFDWIAKLRAATDPPPIR